MADTSRWWNGGSFRAPSTTLCDVNPTNHAYDLSLLLRLRLCYIQGMGQLGSHIVFSFDTVRGDGV
jgi:hypothetical protein